ncbi:RidA family protein, partial [Candidatus Poribacteria bacterium]
MKIEKKLEEMGLEVPEIPKPMANYVPAVRTGNLLFLSGHGPQKDIPTGKVGGDLTIEQGYEAAKSTALCLISTMKN